MESDPNRNPTADGSFPRKRESTAQGIGNALATDWIPASAGMTAPGSARLSQMTPPPSCPLPLCPKNKCGKITHNHFLSHDPFFFESTLGHDSSSAPGRGVLNGEVTFHVDYSSGAVKPRLQKNQQRHLSAVKAHPEVKAQGIPRNRKGIT